MFGGCDVTVSNDVVKNKFHFRPQQMVLHKVLEKTNNTTCYTHRVTFLNATSYNIRRLQTWIKRYKPIVLKKKKSSLSQGFSSCGFATHKWVPEPTHVGRENAIPLLLGQDPHIKKLYPIIARPFKCIATDTLPSGEVSGKATVAAPQAGNIYRLLCKESR